MSHNCKCLKTESVSQHAESVLTTAKVSQLKISCNGQCLLALCLKMSGNRQCLYGQCLNWLCLAPESVWQQKMSFWFIMDFDTQRKVSARPLKCLIWFLVCFWKQKVQLSPHDYFEGIHRWVEILLSPLQCQLVKNSEHNSKWLEPSWFCLAKF